MSSLLYQLIFVISFTATAFAACGHDLTLAEGKIQSLGYPQAYPPNQQCEWKASAAAGKKLTIEFLDFDIHSGGETCTDDFIEIKKAGDINPTTVCGSVKPAIMTIPLDVDVSIKFQSGSIQRTNNRGFIIQYTIKADPTTTASPVTTADVTTGNQTTVATTAVLPTKKSGDKMSDGTIAVICILVILVVLLIIDLILYQKEMGLLYTIKSKCCTEYGSIDGSKC